MVTISYIGGVRWGVMNATWPLMRLTIGQKGVSITPSSRAVAPLLRLFRVADLNFEWADIGDIRLRRSKLPSRPLSNGVCFIVDGKELIWWSTSKANADEILSDIESIVPERSGPR